MVVLPCPPGHRLSGVVRASFDPVTGAVKLAIDTKSFVFNGILERLEGNTGSAKAINILASPGGQFAEWLIALHSYFRGMVRD
jgi:hypothetical protein